MHNQSFYAVTLTLLILISVAMWQFVSLTARSEGLREPYAASRSDDRLPRQPVLAVNPR